MIGIVSQSIDWKPYPDDKRFENYSSYIMAAYVRYLQGFGARIVPFVYDEPESETLDKLSKVNGVLFPGGDGDYLKIGQFIVDHAKKMNDDGQFFPIWGTCLGFENLAIFTAKNGDPLEKYGQSHVSLPLQFTRDPRHTKMFCPMSIEAFKFQTGNYTLNSHSFSLSPKTVESDEGLREMWDVTSITLDENKRPFVASMEGKKYPFMGTQFHPEKVTQAWNDNYGINHSWESIKLNKIFGEQFVAMTRVNNNTFGNYSETQHVLIDNHQKFETTYYAGEVYVFK